MDRYDWLKNEIRQVPRLKFHLLEPTPVSVLTPIEERYGALPSDYKEFVQEFGRAILFEDFKSPRYHLFIDAPPNGDVSEDGTVRIEVGSYINTGNAWIEWREGGMSDGAIFIGYPWRRRKGAASFEDWLRRSIAAARKLYSKQEWAAILTPPLPFSEKEREILQAIPKISFQKVGVSPKGDLLIEIENKSSIELPHLTVGVRDDERG